jgi:SagB-type dehydrogenase family enzyme
MGNRDLEIGLDFMTKSLYSGADLRQGRLPLHLHKHQPLPFKVYQGTTLYRLHQAPPLRLDDPRWSFDEFCQASTSTQPVPQSGELDLRSLSTLLYYAYGFSRHDEGLGVAWPFHRFVASARCFFPIELYVWLPCTEGIQAGIYHYDNLHHSLALLRQGEYGDLLTQALDTKLDHCSCVLLTSALFWKNAFHYLNFSYRLSTQEAGLVTSNALMVASTLGFSGRVHYQFLDQPFNRLLGFETDEESLMTVVSLYPQSMRRGQSAQRLRTKTTAQELCETIEPLTLSYVKTSSFDHDLCTSLTAINQQSFLEDSAEIVQAAPEATCTRSEECIAPPALSTEKIDLAQALSFRSSGDVDFLPMPVSLTQKKLWEIIRYALSIYDSDLQDQPSPPLLQIYLVIQRVEDLDSGIYRLCTDCGMLHVIERSDISLPIQATQTQGNITSSQANLICYLVGDYLAASSTFGNRAYRIMHMEAGFIAQRLCVMSASQGLVARYSNSYDTALCKKLLNLTDSPFAPIAELVIGYEQPGTQAGNRYRFSLLH